MCNLRNTQCRNQVHSRQILFYKLILQGNSYIKKNIRKKSNEYVNIISAKASIQMYVLIRIRLGILKIQLKKV